MTAHWAHLPYDFLGRCSLVNDCGRVARGVRHLRQAAGDDRVGVAGPPFGCRGQPHVATNFAVPCRADDLVGRTGPGSRGKPPATRSSRDAGQGMSDSMLASTRAFRSLRSRPGASPCVDDERAGVKPDARLEPCRPTTNGLRHALALAETRSLGRRNPGRRAGGRCRQATGRRGLERNIAESRPAHAREIVAMRRAGRRSATIAWSVAPCT